MNLDQKKRKLKATLTTASRLAEEVLQREEENAGTLVEKLKAEHRKALQSLTALAVAFIADMPVPISIFKPFAGYSMFRKWELAGLLQLVRKNGKTCIVPSQFCEFWSKL